MRCVSAKFEIAVEVIGRHLVQTFFSTIYYSLLHCATAGFAMSSCLGFK